MKKNMPIKKKYRVKSKLRFTIFSVVVMLFMACIIGNYLGLDEASSMTPANCMTVEIHAGDTLWDLARTYGPDDTDVRQIVKVICSYNETSPEELQPGQTILIPKEI